MKDDEDTEGRDNVIAFPGPPPLLDGSYTCEGWAPRVASITAWAPVAPVYNLDNKEDFMAYMAAEMHVALKIQGAYSTPSLPLIPAQACHPFQTKAATDPRAKLPPWQSA